MLFCALLLAGCAPAARPNAPAAPPALLMFELGVSAFESGEYGRAANAFEQAYETIAPSQRGRLAFWWGYSLYRQAEALARSNVDGDPETHEQARRLFEEAVNILALSEHPERDNIINAIEQYLGPDEIRPLRGAD